MNARYAAAILFLATSLSNAASAMYVWGAYASGLPTSWWSGALVLTMLVASPGMGIASMVVYFSARVRLLALVSSGLLKLYLVIGLVYGVAAWMSGGLAWARFATIDPCAVLFDDCVVPARIQPAA